MSVRVQFAFQGGGARLALLLPVVHAILDCEEDEKIIAVTRVAGTSAGAIAAALVSAKADMKSLATELRRIANDEPNTLRDVFPKIGEGIISAAWAALKLIFNFPVSSGENFSKFLGKCLDTAGVDPNTLVEQMNPPCGIIYTDMSTKAQGVVSPETTLKQILLDSTALPFVFRVGSTRLDGGLIDNLPVNFLTAGRDNDLLLAVAFDEDAYELPQGGILSFAASLLDAAISSKTRATKRVLGANYVLSLSPKTGDIVVKSFDVEGFIEFLADENAYERRVNEAKIWIRQRAEEVKKRRAQIMLTPKVLSRPDEAIEQLRSTFDNIGRISKYYHEHENITVLHSAFDVIAHSLHDQSKNDVVRFTDRIRVTSGSINVYVTQFFSSNTAQDAISTQFEVLDNKMRPIEFAVLEVPQPGELAKACVIIFAKPLTAGGPDDVFTIIQEQQTPCVMGPLLDYGADYLSAEVVQAPTAEQVEIALAVPKEFGQLFTDDGTAERLRTLKVHIDKRDLEAPFKSGSAISRIPRGTPPSFTTYGWTASDISRGEQVRVVFRRQNNDLLP